MAAVMKNAGPPDRPPEDHDWNLSWPPRYIVEAQWRESWSVTGWGPWERYCSSVFQNPGDAKGYIQARGGDRSDRNFRVARAPWRIREEHALGRTMPVWWSQPWWNTPEALKVRGDHYVHQSVSDRTLLAYTQDNRKGSLDIQTPIKPGRYLARFFGDILSPMEIAKMAAWQTTGTYETDYNNPEVYPLAFAYEPEAIVEVYKDGPASCMSHDECDYRAGGEHPTMIYGAGDLAIAYLRHHETGKIVARALTWPAKKFCGRIYPTPHCWEQDGFESMEASEACQQALEARLRDDGYGFISTDSRGFNGARLIRHELDVDHVVMPYLDNSYGFNDEGDHLVMHRNGDYCGDDPDGYVEITPSGEPCDNCGDRVDADEISTVYMRTYRGQARGEQAWCQCCRDNSSFFCEGLQEQMRDDVAHTVVDGETYCDAWLRDNAVWSEFSEEYHVDASLAEMPDGTSCTQYELDEYYADHPEEHPDYEAPSEEPAETLAEAV